MESPPPLFTAGEVADLTGFSKPRLTQLEAEGVIKPALRKGRVVLFGLDTLNHLAEHLEARSSELANQANETLMRAEVLRKWLAGHEVSTS